MKFLLLLSILALSGCASLPDASATKPAINLIPEHGMFRVPPDSVAFLENKGVPASLFTHGPRGLYLTRTQAIEAQTFVYKYNNRIPAFGGAK
jgi:hypothetical protein